MSSGHQLSISALGVYTLKCAVSLEIVVSFSIHEKSKRGCVSLLWKRINSKNIINTNENLESLELQLPRNSSYHCHSPNRVRL